MGGFCFFKSSVFYLWPNRPHTTVYYLKTAHGFYPLLTWFKVLPWWGAPLFHHLFMLLRMMRIRWSILGTSRQLTQDASMKKSWDVHFNQGCCCKDCIPVSAHYSRQIVTERSLTADRVEGLWWRGWDGWGRKVLQRVCPCKTLFLSLNLSILNCRLGVLHDRDMVSVNVSHISSTTWHIPLFFRYLLQICFLYMSMTSQTPHL